MMSPTVVVLGEVTEWRAIPSALRDSAVAWLATTPGAIGVLREAEQPGLIAEDLVPADEVERLCVPAYENLRGLCARLDEALPAGAGVFSLALWELGARLDGVLWRATVLERLHVRWPQARVVCWPAAEAANPSRVFELSRSGCRWPAVLARMAWRDASAAAVEQALAPTGAGATPSPRSMGQWLRGNPVIWSAVQLHRQRFGTGAMARLADGSPAWLMFKAPYDWGDTLRQLAGVGQRVIFDEPDRYYAMSSPDRPVSAENHRLFERLWSEFCDDLPPWTQGALKPVAEELRRLIATAPGVMKNLHAVAARSVERFNLRGVINAIGSDLRVQAVLASYRRIGVPVVKWQHGSVWWHNRITQRMDDSDLATSDMHLVYGACLRDAYSAEARNKHCRLVAIGSARLASLYTRFGENKRQRTARKKVRSILYTATNLAGDAWYCGFSPPFMDGLYYRDQCALISRLRALVESDPEMRLTIKLPSNYFHDYPPPWVKELRVSQRCRIVTSEQTHSDLLLEHDSVVIDCATTTLLEALCTDLAVYVLLRAPQWPESELTHLRHRAVCAGDPGELVTALARHLKTGDYAADSTNETFVRRHGLMASSVDAAALLVNNVASASVRSQSTWRPN